MKWLRVRARQTAFANRTVYWVYHTMTKVRKFSEILLINQLKLHISNSFLDEVAISQTTKMYYDY